MIIQTINTVSQFRDEFHRMGRGNQFSYEGLETLFNHLEEVYSNSNWELDVIALCCDFAEYTCDELLKEYGEENEELNELVERLGDSTLILWVEENGNYIIQSF